MGATGKSVRVPYSVFYDVDADKIKALRIYMPMDQLLAQIGGATNQKWPAPTAEGSAGATAEDSTMRLLRIARKATSHPPSCHTDVTSVDA